MWLLLSAKKYSNLTTSWRFEKNENGNFSAFQHLSWVVMCCLCTLQTTVLRIVNFLSKYDKFCTAEKQLKTILSRNGLVIIFFQLYTFLLKHEGENIYGLIKSSELWIQESTVCTNTATNVISSWMLMFLARSQNDNYTPLSRLDKYEKMQHCVKSTAVEWLQ